MDSYNSKGKYINGEQVRLYILGLLFGTVVTAGIACWLGLDIWTIFILMFAFFILTLMISAILFKHRC